MHIGLLSMVVFFRFYRRCECTKAVAPTRWSNHPKQPRN